MLDFVYIVYFSKLVSRKSEIAGCLILKCLSFIVFCIMIKHVTL